MKYIPITLMLAFSALALTGCMTEDVRNCPAKENVTLNFSLLDRNGAEVFKDNIDKTDLIVFGDDGCYRLSRTVGTASLGSSQSIRLTLDPGTYKVVAWGNLNGRVSMCDVSQSLTTDGGTVTCSSSESGDPAYYGACPTLGLTRTVNPGKALFTFTVPVGGTVNETIHFTHAHKKLDIYVKGYLVDGLHPVIEVDGNRRGYDFYMNHLSGYNLTFRQQSVLKTTSEGSMANASFYTSRIRQDNSININIINPVTGATDYSIPLNDVIESFNDFDLEVEITIPIVFEFHNGDFQVRLPSWITQPSNPELD